ncbi:MAG TPA: gluconate 2-dehydrogenase subunit 3 family protein [Terriglobia bacterium]|nr:gluconate 2-dehydrogenase subunit 3 family protein [Terriglobia bacterium]
MQDAVTSTSAFFTGSRAATFLAVAGRVAPREGEGALGAGSELTLQAAEYFLQGQEETVRAKLGVLLRVFEWGALFFFGKRFTRLAPAKQDVYLHAWEHSQVQTFRFGFSSLRNLALLAFYTRPESWPMIGYPGPVLESAAADKRGR